MWCSRPVRVPKMDEVERSTTGWTEGTAFPVALVVSRDIGTEKGGMG